MTKRAHISWKTKYAAALLSRGEIPYDDAKQMHEDQLISLYQLDHGILHAIEPNDAFWNLTPSLIRPHRQKSRRDTGIVAKVKTLSNDHIEFQRRMLAKSPGQPRARKNTIPQRANPWPPKGSRPFQRRAP